MTPMLQLNPLISLFSTSINDKEKLDWINTLFVTITFSGFFFNF